MRIVFGIRSVDISVCLIIDNSQNDRPYLFLIVHPSPCDFRNLARSSYNQLVTKTFSTLIDQWYVPSSILLGFFFFFFFVTLSRPSPLFYFTRHVFDFPNCFPWLSPQRFPTFVRWMIDMMMMMMSWREWERNVPSAYLERVLGIPLSKPQSLDLESNGDRWWHSLQPMGSHSPLLFLCRCK